jgi:hypothetical protein
MALMLWGVPWGICDVSANGPEGVPDYSLEVVCLDLMSLDYNLEVVFGLEGLPITTWRLYVWKVPWPGKDPITTWGLYVWGPVDNNTMGAAVGYAAFAASSAKRGVRGPQAIPL